MIESIVLTIVGLLIGLVITHQYYKRQVKDAKQDSDTTKALLNSANEELGSVRQEHRDQNAILIHQNDQLAALRTENAELKQQVGNYEKHLARLDEFADPNSTTNRFKAMDDQRKRETDAYNLRKQIDDKMDWERMMNNRRRS